METLLPEPGLAEPGPAEPGLAEPGLAEPGPAEPTMAEKTFIMFRLAETTQHRSHLDCLSPPTH
jgi:hypothetical protein